MFQTERLSIYPWSVDDAEDLYLMYSDPEVVRFLPGMRPETVEEQRERVAGVVERYAALGDGTGAFACRTLAESRLVGTALLKKLPGHDLIEVGWHLARPAWGQGFATEMGREMLRYGFEDLGLEYIIAVVDPLNEASKRVALRIGMKPREDIFAYERMVTAFEMFVGDWTYP